MPRRHPEVGDPPVLFEIPAAPAAQWLARTYGMVPRGAELDGVGWDDPLQLTD